MTARTQGAAGKDKPAPKSRATEIMVRVRRAQWLVLSMLTLSLLLVVLGVYITTRAESLNVSGYSSGVILTLGSFLGLLGLCLEENRRQLLTAAIVFLSFGIVASFMCLVVDGACIALNMDIRPLKAGRCQYYSSGSSYIYENFYTSVSKSYKLTYPRIILRKSISATPEEEKQISIKVSCWNPKEMCNMTVRSGTCYCCDLYDCANGDYLSNYYEFIGVQSCEEVFTLYILIWMLAGLNLVAFFTGILNTAVLGSIKDLRSSSPVTEFPGSTRSSPTAPLLMDANTHTVHPTALMYFPPAEGTAAPSVLSPYTESNPPPFTPLTSRLP